MANSKINYKKLAKQNDEMLARMEKKRRNKNNWTLNEGYTIKKTAGFKIAHGNYINGE